MIAPVVTASGHSVYARAYQFGGRGGYGINGADGGAGADSTLTNAVAGATTGGRLDLRQGATGGVGGYGRTGNGGRAGTGKSYLAFNDPTQMRPTTYREGTNRATGGTGGRC